MPLDRRTSERRTATTLRREAEEQLKTRTASDAAFKETDNLRLLHELQVHQIELELQNEELTQAYLEAQALRDKYWDLYDYAPVGYFTLSFLGDILEMNLCAAGMLGKERGVLMGRRLGDFIHPDSLQSFNQFLAEASNEAQNDVCANNLILQRNGNEPIYVETRGRAFEHEHSADKKVRVIMMDVSALKFATDELQHAFQKFFKYWRP